ncbi:hypothetical protein E4K10_18680 [Streptomyces sp. T1317-0309]|nr:hypothetical protein E4K10_18680 [Streptomyces sp. T1317-0309]
MDRIAALTSGPQAAQLQQRTGLRGSPWRRRGWPPSSSRSDKNGPPPRRWSCRGGRRRHGRPHRAADGR